MTHPRRSFLQRAFSASCGLPAVAALSPIIARKSYARQETGNVIAKRPFGRIEELAEGVWALISTPFDRQGGPGDRRTHSNGGLIAGKDRVLAIDSYRTAEGARFLAEASRFLTGRLPTHVVNTHFHFDHLGGTRGLADGAEFPEVIMTQTTRNLAFQTYLKTKPREGSPLPQTMIQSWGGHLTDATMIIEDESQPFQLDLGGRIVELLPLSGHTGSDLIVRDPKSKISFGGDLIWDGIFPNFMSAQPTSWAKSVDHILSQKEDLIVPGHGSAARADSKSLQTYRQLLQEIGNHATLNHRKGVPSDQAAQNFRLPASLGDWSYFRDGFHEIAMETWYRQLSQ